MKKLLLLVLSVILLAACSTQNEDDQSGAKDTFTYAISGDPISTNPVTVSDRWGHNAMNLIYNRLTRTNQDGTTKYELAESVNISEDGLSLTVKLKEGIKWSDGEALTADDVVFSYTQKANKDNGSADALWINDEPIQFEKVDDLTVRFTLPSLNIGKLNGVTSAANIIPEHIYSGVTDFSAADLGVTHVGTGPYKLVEYKQSEYLRFEANELYFEGEAQIKNIVFRIIASADTTKIALQKGEVDASFVLPGDIEDLKSNENLQVYEFSENRVGYLGLNNNSAVLQDVRVRQAVFFALNRDDFNNAAYLDSQFYSNAYTILPPQNPFATEEVEKYEQDLNKAKQLLAEAGNPVLNLKLGYIANDSAQTVQATLIQQNIQALGGNVELIGLESAALSTEIRKPDSTAYDLFLGGYIMGDDPDSYSQLFGSEGAWNYFKYHSETADALFAQGAVELDETKRAAIYKELQQVIQEDATFFPIVDNKRILVVNTAIGGVEDAKLVPIYTFEDASKLYFK